MDHTMICFVRAFGWDRNTHDYNADFRLVKIDCNHSHDPEMVMGPKTPLLLREK